ncbi:MAG: 3-dehydroquinate synthase II [Methanobacteriaceae archaeon]
MKFAWVMTPQTNWNEKKEIITTSLESGINHFLDIDDNSETIKKIHKLGDLKIINQNEDSDIVLVGINSEGDSSIKIPEIIEDSKDLNKAQGLKNKGKQVGAYIEINSKKHEELAVKIGRVADFLILVGKDWKVIPLENIIADLQKEDVKIIAAASDYDEAKLALETLEVGTDGVIFQTTDFSQIKKMAELIQNLSNEEYELKEATVTEVRSLGIGDRVCIDTTTIMHPGEGMLIGSYSKAMFLVHSESLESEYVASRPFRVNAGPVQAYIRVPNNKTRYLSELETGDEVLVVDDTGKSRRAIVGRIKIEKRPFILIEAEYEGEKIKTLLQNAETIRMVNNENNAISVSDIKKGDKLKVYIDSGARHFGMSIEETIIEK